MNEVKVDDPTPEKIDVVNAMLNSMTSFMQKQIVLNFRGWMKSNIAHVLKEHPECIYEQLLCFPGVGSAEIESYYGPAQFEEDLETVKKDLKAYSV